MLSIESINLRINKLLRIRLSLFRRNKINKDNFSIISNNCWGGMIYESYGLEKQSPTVGLFFTSKDYIKFISKFKYYINKELKFIDYEKSNIYPFLINNNISKDVPIGRLDDVEIVFLHYKDKKVAKEKWNKRVKRINYKNIIFKFNDQNDCNEKDLQEFLKLPYKNKLFFTTREWKIKNSCIIKIPQLFNRKYILSSHEPFGNNIFFNVNNYINNIHSETFFNKI